MNEATTIRLQEEEEAFRDTLSTLDEEGKRKWIYPKKTSGKFTQWRKWVSYILLAFLVGAPFIKLDGEPFLLFNVLDRTFVLFGQVFWPQDFHLFVIAMITLLVFIILFTVVWGRIFCGWLCPQTIFMEWVFRRIEYWIEGDYMTQRKLDKMPLCWEKVWKKSAKHSIFLLISILIMHTFMAYIIGVGGVWEIVQGPPSDHLAGFVAMIFFTGMFYLVFSRLREQVCTNICPYGRLQGVLLDKDSVVVAYDYKRGETRSKFRKGEDRTSAEKGDCIDCKQCVLVCPTGIDIRNGTQLECINCTACIDACDNVMEHVSLPKGLIRYVSEENIAQRRPFRFTGRMTAYTGVLLALVGVLVTLLLLRTEVETSLLRTPGMMYQEREDGRYSNLYNYKIINKTNRAFMLDFRLEDSEGELELVGERATVEGQGVAAGALFIILRPEELDGIKTTLRIGVYADDQLIETVKTTFIGPSL